MVTDFMDALRKTMIASGFAKVEDSEETWGDATAVIGYNGRLYTIEADLQVGEMALPYCAIGCGADFAFGSLETSMKISKRMAPRKRVIMGLEAAAAFSAAVCPPFIVMSL